MSLCPFHIEKNSPFCPQKPNYRPNSGGMYCIFSRHIKDFPWPDPIKTIVVVILSRNRVGNSKAFEIPEMGFADFFKQCLRVRRPAPLPFLAPRNFFHRSPTRISDTIRLPVCLLEFPFRTNLGCYDFPKPFKQQSLGAGALYV